MIRQIRCWVRTPNGDEQFWADDFDDACGAEGRGYAEDLGCPNDYEIVGPNGETILKVVDGEIVV